MLHTCESTGRAGQAGLGGWVGVFSPAERAGWSLDLNYYYIVHSTTAVVLAIDVTLIPLLLDQGISSLPLGC